MMKESALVCGTQIHAAQVEQQEVLAISFHPDKAVACEEPVVLSKGHPAKAMRRGGMCRRGAQQEVTSIPDTAPGEYDD